MELKLNVYKTRKCKEIDRTLIVNEFELSTGACEDILRLVNIDQFDSLASLSEESQAALIMKTIVNGFDLFKDILKDVFDALTDEDISKTKIGEITTVIVGIVKYSIQTLFSTFGAEKRLKN